MKLQQVLTSFSDLSIEKRTTIKDLFNIFITEKIAQNVSEFTITYYKNGILDLLEKHGVVYVDEITKEKINEIIVKERIEKPNNAVRTFNTKLKALRTFVYYCQEKELLSNFRIKLLREQETPKETYSDDELKALIRKPSSRSWTEWRDWAVINYLIATGNRASSIINIKIKDIDFANKWVELKHTKNGKAQIVPLCESILDVINTYLKTFKWNGDDYLFPTVNMTQWKVSSFQQDIRKYNHKRGVNKTSIHLFRHTFAKNYLLNGGSISQLQKLLGHSTSQMSLHYAQIYGMQDLTRNYEDLNPLNRIK